MIEDVPPGYLTFGFALGQDKPRSLVISPASVDGNVNTVLELGFLHELNEGALNLLQQLSSSIAIAVRPRIIVESLRRCSKKPSANRRSFRFKAKSCASPMRNSRSRAAP